MHQKVHRFCYGKMKKMKHNQYFVVQDWTGGIYASTSLPGSRVGSQIATTWSTLLYHGYESYKNYSQKIIEKTEYLKNEISKIKTFHVIGNPNVNVVAFYSDTYSVGQLSEHLTSFLWNINILQNPICLHICITPKNIEACPLELAPTSSTTCALALGDAIAVTLLKKKGFTEKDFKALHPGGKLGQILLQVKDVMKKKDALPILCL